MLYVRSRDGSDDVAGNEGLQKDEARTLGFHGMCFGADGLFSGSCCSKDIVARTKCQTRALTRESCRHLIKKHPRIKKQLLANLRSLGHKVSSEILDSLAESNPGQLSSGSSSENTRSILRGTLGSCRHISSHKPSDDTAQTARVELDTRSVYPSFLLSVCNALEHFKKERRERLQSRGRSVVIQQ